MVLVPKAAHAPAKDLDVDAAALLGRVLVDKYKVTGLLGVGGIGRVYRAEHLVLRRAVALKVLLEQYQCVPELQRRFEREAMALAALTHPNIVTITDFVSSRDVTFLVMELVEGQELGDLIEEGPLAAGDAFMVMEQLLSSLAYAHEREVIHRDLKPQNVLVRRLPGGRLHAEILDFGLAKFMDGSGPGANLTKTGLIIGTPAYMAPEQASGATADQRSDVYAAAIMFFEMLTGTLPFEGEENVELMRQHLLTEPPKLVDRAPDARIAPELEAFIQRALAKRGADRFADGTAMLEAFLALPRDAFRAGTATVRKQRSQAESATALANTNLALPASAGVRVAAGTKDRRRMLPWIVFALGLVMLAAAAALFAFRTPDETPPRIANQRTEQEAPQPTETLPAAIEEEEAIEEGDNTLEQPAEAPLEEDEEEIAPLPAPATRVAARNPWGGREPEAISRVRRRLMQGHPISQASMRQVANYRRRNPSDVRSTLLLARVYGSRGWHPSALAQYQRAYRRDPSSRGDPRMKRDLIRMVASEALHEAASVALVEIYGSEAVEALEEALAREQDPAIRARLTAALARVRPS